VTTFLVCSNTGFFGDDVAARCARCHAAIVHRPHVPPEAVTICFVCAALQMLDDDDLEIRVTDETRREVALYHAKTAGTKS
jgi:hypothetical protein